MTKKQFEAKDFSKEALEEIITGILKKLGVPEKDSRITADVLISAELRNIPSHGLIRLPDYIGLLENGRINPSPAIKTIHETLSTAVIDGDGGLGTVVAVKSMETAIEKAKTAGTGWVAVRNSNHYGIAGYYSMMALKHDMTGISMTNANPLVAPTFSKDRLYGTNPISVAIPAGEQPPFVVDMATSAIARGKLYIKQINGEKVKYGYVQDKEGNPSNEPGILTEGGSILPLGSSYEYGSHRGYCMAATVDILSSIFSGAGFGPFVPPSVPFLDPLKEKDGEGIGHFFGALRIDAFQSKEEFKKRMDKWIETFKNAKPTKENERVLIPGDPEREAEEKNKNQPINISEKLSGKIKTICEKYNVDF